MEFGVWDLGFAWVLGFGIWDLLRIWDFRRLRRYGIFNMSATSKITWKYLKFFSKSKAVMAMTIISILGIVIGVATLTVTFSVAKGFGKEYRKSILDFNAHVVLLSTEEIDDTADALEKIEKYKSTPEEVEEWKASSNAMSVLRLVEYFWQMFDHMYISAQYSPNLSPAVFDLLDKVHPKSLAEWARSKDIYPKNIVERIVKLLKLSQRGVVGVSPFIYREGLLIHKGQIRGIMIKGVKPSGIASVSNMEVEFPAAEGGVESIILGSYLAKEIGAKVGDRVRLMLPEHWGESGPSSFKEFEVVDTFESGMYDFDSQFALLELERAQKIFNAGDKVSGIELKLDDWKKSPMMAMKLEQEFPYPIYASDWKELNRSLFEAVQLEKLMFIIIMGALVIVAAFNIIGTIMLRILYKTSDISILRALGMKTSGIKRVFVMQGLFVGIIGTTIGLVLALAFIWSITKFGWIKIPPEIYLLKTLPVCISALACVMIAAFSLIVCWLTSSIASQRILELPVIRGLHRP